MRQETINIYTYNELSDDAKENARNWYNSDNDDFITFYYPDHLKDGYYSHEYFKENFGIDFNGCTAIDMYQETIEFEGYEICNEYRFLIEFMKWVTPPINRKQRKQLYRIFLKLCYNDMIYKSNQTNRFYSNYEYYGKVDDLINSVLGDLDEFLEFIEWKAFKLLQKDFEYTQSKEYIEETIIANEYEFYVDGRKY